MLTLRDLKEGEKGIITKVKGRGAFRKRITEMGFIKGKLVTVIRSAPFQDPVEYQILKSFVSIRRSEANLIEVISETEARKQLRGTQYEGVITDEQLKISAREKGRQIEVALVGNPNSGKTTLFNFASHSREHVANYGGVTIDSKLAKFKQDGYVFNITDLPGTYSITDYSPEELFVRKHILGTFPDVVINVIDASNLERNLYLTTQLIDMDIKVIVALNMYDELILKGDHFDYKSLGNMLGIPFVRTVATRGKGIKELFRKVIDVYEDKDPTVRHIHINYGDEIEQSVRSVQEPLRENKKLIDKTSSRYYAIKLLEKDKSTDFSLSSLGNYETIRKRCDEEIGRLENILGEDSETLITDAKYGFIEGALKETYTPARIEKKSISQKLDSFFTGKYLSYPIFVAFMWVMFQTTFIVGEYPVLWIESLVAVTGNAVDIILPESMFKDLLIEGIIGGVGGVIVFLPNILILFFFISIMEDSGYMARVAFILDKLMHKIGLHGRSFIPLLMGFGCNVPAIMATRTIENKTDRLVTMLVTPFMSCSARYPIYILLISAFFTSYHGTILFGIYAFGIMLAGAVAWMLKNTILKSQEMPFVMELPPYRLPTVKSIMKHTWFKGSQYLRKIGGVILIASVIIWALGYFPRNTGVNDHYDVMILQITEKYNDKISVAAQWDPESVDGLTNEMIDSISGLDSEKQRLQQEYSFIGRLGKFIEPVIAPLGFDWRTGVSLIAGAAAKEVVVSTMGVLYQSNTEKDSNGLISTLRNLTYNSGKLKGQKVFSPLIALTIMLFVLIYFPCIAVVATIKKESGAWKWSLFLVVYTTAMAWTISFLFYQGGTLLGF